MGWFHTLLIVPIFNLLVFFYDIIPGKDMGVAIILLTILIKLILWPFMNSSLKSQKALQEIQPKIEELKVTHKDDKEGLAKAMMELYKVEKVSPFASCLPMLVQFPILIALYRVLLQGFDPSALGQLYPFIPNPGTIEPHFLGFLNLGVPNIWLALIAGVFQFFQTRMLTTGKPPKQVQGTAGAKDETMLASMNKSMLYFMPAVTVLIGARLPGGLALYWVTVTVFSLVQQIVVFKQKQRSKEVKTI
ncbi:membrane protein insertase YidC [Candidatus Uhrbacteria bacterium]|nr:membrane protein insertase YidC [Candidatus Uhrbacteria bacterium]